VSTVAAILLGAVFLLSAITKLAAPARWRTQAAQLIDAPLVGLALPWVELATGALLVSGWQRHRVAIFAGALLVMFDAVLAVRLREGRRPPCACFGSLSSRPISWVDVVRNFLFIGVAIVAAV
jgi:hypothetical protein